MPEPTNTSPRRGPNARAACGTPAAYRRHIRNNEPVDAACRDANAEHSRTYYAAGPKNTSLPPIDHGTPWGARQHWYRKVPLCVPCSYAYSAHRTGGAR